MSRPAGPGAGGALGGHPSWTLAAPLAALALAGAAMAIPGHRLPGPLLPVAALLLLAAVFAAVHHAEVVARRVGPTWGAIVLAVCVTAIEVALILSLLLGGPPGGTAVARDTVFAVLMLVLNGVVGLCLLVGGLRHREQLFQARGAAAALGVLGTVAVLALVLPNFTQGVEGPLYAPAQLGFVAVVSILLYALFLWVQVARHPEDFLDPAPEAPGAAPEPRAFVLALAALPFGLLAVILLAEALAPAVERGIAALGWPAALLGVVVAMVTLLPEGVTALRAAWGDRVQASLNLSLGSALASICLTVPAVAAISLLLDRPLILGLEAEHVVLLVLTLFMSTLSLAVGRTTVMQGAIHLVIFGAFLIVTAVP